MSVINLKTSEIFKIKQNINISHNVLTNNYFKEINNNLEEIKKNISGQELNKIINNIQTNFSSVNKNFKNIFTKLDDFLTSQLKSYYFTEEETSKVLKSVLLKMYTVANSNSNTNSVSNNNEVENKQTFPYVKSDIFNNFATFTISGVSKFYDLGEGVLDSHIYGTGKLLKIFGVDDTWSKNIVKYEIYDYDQIAKYFPEDIAYGTAHSIGNVVGESAGYTTLASVPYVGTALCAFAGAGTAAENSMNEQEKSTGEINDMKVFGDSLVGSAKGYAAGTFAKKIKKPLANAQAQGTGNVVSNIAQGAIKGKLKGAGAVVTNTIKTASKDERVYISAAAEASKNLLANFGNYKENFDWKSIVTTTVPDLISGATDAAIDALTKK